MADLVDRTLVSVSSWLACVVGDSRNLRILKEVKMCSLLKRGLNREGYSKVIGGDTECPLQVCQLSRSSESTQLLCLRRDVALFDSTRAPDSF